MTDEHTEDCPHCSGDISDIVGGLKSALEKTREEKKEAIRKLRALQDHSVSQEEYDARLAELEAAKAETVPRSEFESLTTQLEEMKTENESLHGERETNNIVKAINKTGGNAELLTPHVRTIKKENPNLSDDEAAQVAKDKFSHTTDAYKASDHSGGGSDAGAGRNHIAQKMTQMTDLRRSTMTDAEKVRFQKEHGLEALLNLPL